MIGLGIESVGTIPVTGESVSSTATALGSIYLLPTDKLRFSVTGGGGLFADNPRNAVGRVMFGMPYSLSARTGGLL